MPIYLYANPKTKEVVEIVQHMNESHEYQKDGIKYKRVWTKPRMSVDAIAVDCYSAKDFARITNKPGTVGELHDRSAEMSARRADKDGVDHIREKHFDQYEKTHKGQVHPERKRERGAKKLKEAGISVDWGD